MLTDIRVPVSLAGRLERKTLTQFGDTHEKYAIIIPLDIERTIEARCGSWVGCPSSTCPRLAFTFVRFVASGCWKLVQTTPRGEPAPL